MGKGRYLKNAERACTRKARFETAAAAEAFSEYRYRAYHCPVCHGYHLTSQGGLPPVPPKPVEKEPGPTLGDLEWSELRARGTPSQRTVPPKPPKPVELPKKTATCVGSVGKDGRVPLLFEGRHVKSRPIPAELRPLLKAGTVVEVEVNDARIVVLHVSP